MKKQTSMPIMMPLKRFMIMASAIAIAILCQTPGQAQDDAFARLKAIARTQDTLKSKLPQVTITKDNPVWEQVSRTPIPFKPIPMVDKNGKVIPANQMVTLPSGKQITAAEYFDRLNVLERKLNAQGHSLRDTRRSVVSRIVTPKADLDGRTNSTPKAVGNLKTAEERARFTDPKISTGSATLKPLGDYSPAERKKIQSTVIPNTNISNYKVATIKTPVIFNGHTFSGPRLLKTIDETTARDQHFGKASSFLAGVDVSLTRFAKIYGTDPQHPNTNISEYKVSGKGRIYTSIIDHAFDVLNVSGEFYVPADSSKKMNARVVVVLAGITVLNMDEKYEQRKEVHGVKAKNFDKSLPISFPIVAGLDFSGLIGIKGTIGFEYTASLDRTFLKGELKPFASVTGYAEAGVSVGEVFGLGVGGEVRFLDGNVDLTAWIGLYNQNGAQIVFGYGYDVSYYLEFLSGRLYVYGRLCDPWGIVCWTEDADIFTWTGFKDFGTYADGRNLFFIDNAPTTKTSVSTPSTQ